MDVAGLPDEPDAGSYPGRGSAGALGSRPRSPRGGTPLSEWVCVGQEAPVPAPGPEPASGAADPSAAAAATADRRQAEYFLGLLVQRRRLADRRADECRKAVAAAEAGGDDERAYNYRRMARTEEQDRRTLDGLIENLHRRFARAAPGNVPTSAEARIAAR